MFNLKQHIVMSEALRSPSGRELDNSFAELTLNIMSKYKSDPVLWRGFKAKKMNYIGIVRNRGQRKFRGSSYGFEPHEALDAVISNLSKFTPVFCSFEVARTKMFGTPYIVVPIPKFECHISEVIYDVGMITTKRIPTSWGATGVETSWNTSKAVYTDAQVGEMIDSYTTTVNSIPSKSHSEVLLDAPRYGLVDVQRLIKDNRSKFLKIKSVEQIKTYSDVMHLLRNTMSYLNWKNNNE